MCHLRLRSRRSRPTRRRASCWTASRRAPSTLPSAKQLKAFRQATAGRLTDAKLATIVETFSREGVVVLDAAMDHDALDQLRLFSDANIVRAATILDGPQLAPRAHPWVLAEIVANPIVEGVAAALLGESCMRWHRNFNV